MTPFDRDLRDMEREIKWEVDERFVLPRIGGNVDGGNVEQATVELSSTYYDTADRDLQTHGVLLRRDDSGWRLEVPDERIEIHARPSEAPPSELTDMLTGLRLGKPLIDVATKSRPNSAAVAPATATANSCHCAAS